MFKKILPLILVLVISGCVAQDVILSTLNIDTINSAGEKISVRAEVPVFVRENQTFSWRLEVTPEWTMQLE